MGNENITDQRPHHPMDTGVSRRGFLKASALSAAGLTFSGFPVMAGPFSGADVANHVFTSDITPLPARRFYRVIETP